MSAELKKAYVEIWISFPERININHLKEIQIHPKYEARFFEVEFISEIETEWQQVDPTKAISIDLGVSNLATCISTDGASFIMDGKRIKSLNHWYNKENARWQSEKDRQGIKRFTYQQEWCCEYSGEKRASTSILSECLKVFWLNRCLLGLPSS